jgi:hypothetical protein
MVIQQDRDKGLFTAVVSVAAGLELGATLRRIVQAAVELVEPPGARWGCSIPRAARRVHPRWHRRADGGGDRPDAVGKGIPGLF